MNNPIIYIFLNKSLNMSAGKCSAQAVHAVVKAMANEDPSKIDLWRASMQKTVIVLEARDENHIINIAEYLKERGFKTSYVIDEGVNEIDPHVYTALSSQILDKDDDNVIKAFETFRLYQDKIKVSFEIIK